jgi:hypothetical protein
MTQVSTSEVKCGRVPSLQQKVAAACIFALVCYRKISGLVAVGGVKHSSSDNKWLLAADRKYGLEADSGQKLLQFAFWDNFWGSRGC